MLETNSLEIIDYVGSHSGSSSKAIHEGLASSMSYATVKRMLSKLVSQHLLITSGHGKSTRYSISPAYQLLQPMDLKTYFLKEIDERKIISSFNFSLLEETLATFSLFTDDEWSKLHQLHSKYTENIAQLSITAYQKELERLAIDLSWKSSQIEGNTYTLLETERLLKEKETAAGRTKEEAMMLLNHKEAIDFLVASPDYLVPLTISKIEDLHSILVKALEIDKNIRKRKVGISGTNYQPLDNEFQIREALQLVCELVNKKEHPIEKALLALVLISYVQPFADGNKRTARIVSNAILMHYNYCPLSFRTVDSLDYKKAILLFYEQNNISSFKQIFMDQYEFAVNTYF